MASIDRGPPAALLGVAQVHPQQVAGEQGRLLAALPGLDLEDDVAVVVGVARDEQPAQRAPRPRRAAPRARAPPRRTTASSAASSRAAAEVVARPLPRVVGGDGRGQRGIPLVQRARRGPGRRAPPGRPAAPRGRRARRRALRGLEHGGLLRLGSAGGGRRATTKRRPPTTEGRGTGASGELLGGLLAVAGLEPGHAATGVEDLLLARVERVALRADVGGILPDVAVLRVVNVLPQVQVTVVST